MKATRFVDQTKVYRIMSVNSDLILSVQDGSVEDGVPILQTAWIGSTSQLWRLKPVGGVNQGYFLISCVKSAKCLDVSRSTLYDYGEVVQWRCHGKHNQQWKLTPEEGERLVIQCRHSEKFLDVADSSIEDGAAIIQMAQQKNSRSQQWLLIEHEME